jgi:hypothetical protein
MRMPNVERYRVLARVLWVSALLVFASLFITGLARYYDQLLSLTSPPPVGDIRMLAGTSSDATAMREALRQLGLPVAVYAGYLATMQVGFALPFVLVGILIFWRKGSEPVVWRLSLILVTVLVTSPNIINALAGAFPGQRLFLYSIAELSLIAFLPLFFFIFPDGRFVPNWTRWIMVLAVVVIVLYLLVAPLLLWRWPAFVKVCFIALSASSVIYPIVYRYRHAASPAQRQQIKWVVFGTLGACAGVGAAYIPLLFFPALTQPGVVRVVYDLVSATIVVCTVALIPLSLYIAITRYQLWDIDAIINKALVYGALSAILSIIFVVGVFGLQAMVRTTIGQDSPVALVAFTLIIAGLFQPLRSGLQRLIDRRFYRRKYDAQKTLAAFSATLRQEVSLVELRERLVGVVNETMQPSHVSLWLASPLPVAATAQNATPALSAQEGDRV